MTTTASHQLAAAGAAFDLDGTRIFPTTTSGWGRAKCSCGWMSDKVEFGRTRKNLHKEHVLAESGNVEALIGEIDAFIAEADKEADRFEKAPEPETTPEQPEVSPEGAFAVEWPAGVAKLFFRALAKDGALSIAEAHGMRRVSNETRFELLIVGPTESAEALAINLTYIFARAEQSLKQWRKTSPNYKRFDLKTNAGRRDAFIAEQNYLRDFCRAVAGTFTQDMIAQDGVQAGIAFVNEAGELL